MQITTSILDALDARYKELLELTPHAHRLISTPELADMLRGKYVAAGFVKVENVIPAESFATFVASLLPILSPIAEQIVMRHTLGSDHTLSDGFRFSRVDPDCTCYPETKAKLTQLLKRLGLIQFGRQLASELAPLVRSIAGPVSFRRVYFYIYYEGDYISVHDDRQVGYRVEVQFPISLGTTAGLRVLSDGYLRMHYDRSGSMNVLGPCIWHDVPPILRTSSVNEPVRFNMGFRFTPET
jgi:hypothetical protein